MLDFPPLKGKRMKIGWDLAVGAAILIGALGLRAVDPLPLQTLRNLTFDSYQRLKPRQYDPNVPVVIAAIDEKSLDKFGQWPWSRATLAKITDRLTELGAAAIAFDVIFAEPDRTSPAAIVANLPADAQYEPVKAQLATLPDPDAEFAAALARSPSVLGFAYSDDAQLKDRPPIQYRLQRHGDWAGGIKAGSHAPSARRRLRSSAVAAADESNSRPGRGAGWRTRSGWRSAARSDDGASRARALQHVRGRRAESWRRRADHAGQGHGLWRYRQDADR